MTTKLYAIAYSTDRSVWFFMTACPVSVYTGAAELIIKGGRHLDDPRHNADWLRETLKDRGIWRCVPGKKSRGQPNKHEKWCYKRPNRFKIMLGRIRD